MIDHRKVYAGLKMRFSGTIFISLCILLSLCSLKVLAGVDLKLTETNGLELQVMSFNIRNGAANDGENHWKNRRQMVFELLRNHKSDVIGLQEALKFQIDEIIEAVPEYGMVGVGRDGGKTEGEYSAILYNRQRFKVDESDTFWLSDTPQVPGSITWGNACTRICTWARLVEKKTGKAFYMYNLHLDHVSQPSREKSVALVTERIRQRKYKEPFVLTGDFNAGENNPAILYLKGKAALDNGKGGKSKNPLVLVDTFRVLHPDANEVGTFHEFKGLRSGDKIDYIFTTPDVKVLEASILRDNTEGRYPSDHFPVVAEILISAKGRDSSE
jgi:endonuclease/exonuclease/phosphatase family metal-dependent hydrolase